MVLIKPLLTYLKTLEIVFERLCNFGLRVWKSVTFLKIVWPSVITKSTLSVSTRPRIRSMLSSPHLTTEPATAPFNDRPNSILWSLFQKYRLHVEPVKQATWKQHTLGVDCRLWRSLELRQTSNRIESSAYTLPSTTSASLGLRRLSVRPWRSIVTRDAKRHRKKNLVQGHSRQLRKNRHRFIARR